jgi:hypothetical protein
MAITPDSTQPEQPQLEQPQPVSDELYRSKGSGLPERNENRPTGKNGYQKRIDKITARNHALEDRNVEMADQIHELEIKVRELQSENDFFLKQLLERLNEKQCSAEALAVEAERLAEQLETRLTSGVAEIGKG